jgi:hypothetical protein
MRREHTHKRSAPLFLFLIHERCVCLENLIFHLTHFSRSQQKIKHIQIPFFSFATIGKINFAKEKQFDRAKEMSPPNFNFSTS